jgi:hypothetical protein
LRGKRCDCKHLRLWVHSHYFASEEAERDRGLPRTAAKIEHAVTLSKTHHFGDAPDQSQRVGNPSGPIMQSCGFETARVKGWRSVMIIQG